MIEIVTYHKTTNYGALLQSLSLKEFIEKISNSNVKMCEYHPEKLIFAECYRPLITKNLKKFLQTLKKNLEIYFWYRDAFKSKKKDESSKFYVYGSDEIWNFTNAYHGYDPYYFGKDNNLNKISYAASIGRSSFNNIKDNLRNEITNCLNKFNHISVRDHNSFNFVNKLTGIKPSIVLDPTLIHTPKILESEKYIKFKVNKNYIVVYGTVFSDEQKRLINNFSKRRKLDIISVGYYNNWIKKNYLGLNPTNFIDVIKNSSFVFTSMFHGVMFSVKYSKQFLLSMDPIRKNKIESFINSLNLNNRIFENQIIEDEIDYYQIYKKLNPLIIESQKFLIDNLNNLK